MSTIELLHTDSAYTGFQQLCFALEQELFLRDGDLADKNHELNKIGFLQDVVLLFIEHMPVGCGAFREYDPDTVEIKRMYVMPSYRNNNFASNILAELEAMARQKGFKYSVLETGKNQPEAISLYLKHGYAQVENSGRYASSMNTVCFSKQL